MLYFSIVPVILSSSCQTSKIMTAPNHCLTYWKSSLQIAGHMGSNPLWASCCLDEQETFKLISLYWSIAKTDLSAYL
jgi:hypothetical protein